MRPGSILSVSLPCRRPASGRADGYEDAVDVAERPGSLLRLRDALLVKTLRAILAIWEKMLFELTPSPYRQLTVR